MADGGKPWPEDVPVPVLLGATGRRFPGVGQEGGAFRSFRFVQMADTQLGMEAGFVAGSAAEREEFGWAAELALAEQAAKVVNKLRPAFAIVCGDLVNEYPAEERGMEGKASSEMRARQERDFQAAMKLIDPDIPLLCVCGNHDVGNRPNAKTIDRYVSTFGDDYFVFWCHGVRCIVLNSQLWKDDQDAKEQREAMDQWFEAVLGEAISADGTAAPCPRTIVFSHIPPFIFDQDERNGYFNLDRRLRRRLLARLAGAGCCGWFAGHYHRNAVGTYQDSATGRSFEVVTTGAVGTQIRDKAGGDALELSGIGKHAIGPSDSGLRVVHVLEDHVEHKWHSFAEFEAEWHADPKTVVEASPAKRPKL